MSPQDINREAYHVGTIPQGDTDTSIPDDLAVVGELTTGTLVLPTNLRTGFIPLPLGSWRKITTNDIGAIAVASGNGGQLAKDTTPILERINAATDKKLRIHWAATVVDEIQQDFVYPPDLDDASPVEVHLIYYKGTNTDTTMVAAVSYWEGIGDTNAGGNTAALTGLVATEVVVTITAANVGAMPKAAAVGIIPGTHGNDALFLLGSWIEYTRVAT